MKRRSFIRSATIGGFFHSSTFSFAEGPIVKNDFTIPENELLGMDRPKNLTGDSFNLRPEAAKAFEAMRSDAANQGVTMHSQSSYRSFDHQARIWNAKFARYAKVEKSPEKAIQKIIEFSSLPGSSRHHWGTDLDIIDLAPKRPQDVLHEKHYQKGAAFEKLYQYLLANGARFGFYEVYTNDPSRPGFAYEPWHWSYAPISIPLLRQYVSLSLVEKLPLKRLKGSDQLTPQFLLDYVVKWGLGINPELKQARNGG